MLAVSLAHNADAVRGPQPQCLVGTAGGDPRTVGAERHAAHRATWSAPTAGFGEGCRKRYDFVPYIDLPDGWFTKDGNSYCSEHWTMVRRRVTTSKEVRHKRKKGRK